MLAAARPSHWRFAALVASIFVRGGQRPKGTIGMMLIGGAVTSKRGHLGVKMKEDSCHGGPPGCQRRTGLRGDNTAS